MARHHSHSIEFKRQVVQDYLAGGTDGLSNRHELSRNLVRMWVQRYQDGVFGAVPLKFSMELSILAACRGLLRYQDFRRFPDTSYRHPVAQQGYLRGGEPLACGENKAVLDGPDVGNKKIARLQQGDRQYTSIAVVRCGIAKRRQEDVSDLLKQQQIVRLRIQCQGLECTVQGDAAIDEP